jgi:hypothetical protein
MTSGPFRIELLSSAHDRSNFHSGEDALDRYFQTQVTQDIRRRITNCFVAVEAGTGQLAAYYTLSAASISVLNLPPEVTKVYRVIPHCPRFASAAWLWIKDFKDTVWACRCR